MRNDGVTAQNLTFLQTLRHNSTTLFSSQFYITIRLFALHFYDVIVDEAEGRINYHLIEIKSE